VSWLTLSPAWRELATRVCTEKELEALKLKVAGYGERRIAVVLNISRTTVRDRLRNAERKLLAAGEPAEERD
jgi:DNA-binding CsgD family transcriptional regulator